MHMCLSFVCVPVGRLVVADPRNTENCRWKQKTLNTKNLLDRQRGQRKRIFNTFNPFLSSPYLDVYMKKY